MTTTHRTTLAALPDPLRGWLAQRLADDLLDAGPDVEVHLSVGEDPRHRPRWWRRDREVPAVRTVVLLQGPQLLVAVSTKDGSSLLRGPLADLVVRPGPHRTVPGATPGLLLPAEVHGVVVEGLPTSDGGRSSLLVATGAPDGPTLAALLTDAVRAARR